MWAHFVAIGGTGMGALAALLQDLGFYVTGSDGPLYPPMSTFLESRKIPLKSHYDAKNLEGSSWGLNQGCPDLVIVGNAISKNHVEAQAVEKLVQDHKTKRLSFAAGLAEFCIKGTKSFVVAGTHGKTTTTTLLAWTLESLGLNPGFFIGGIPKNFAAGCRVGGKKIFVSEGDEYDTSYWDKESKFLHYLPNWVLCTGVEFDHADIFKDLAAVEAAFLKLVSKSKEGWLLVDDESAPRADSLRALQKAIHESKQRLARYGFQSNSEYRLLSFQSAPLPWDSGVNGVQLHIECKRFGKQEFFSPMPGKHNALNVCGIYGVLTESGELKDPKQFQQALKTFLGIKRRQEELFKNARLIVIDDFAHHPTAIRETLLALRDRYQGFKIAAFFEPRSATSSRNLMAREFEECFDAADAIFLTPSTKANVPQEERLNVGDLISKISKRLPAVHCESQPNATLLAQAFEKWRAPLRGAKVVAAVMTNGPFDGIHSKIIQGEAGNQAG